MFNYNLVNRFFKVITDIYAAPTIRITPVIKAESDPKKKDLMVGLVIQLLK